jgi:hypothetical protein
LKNGAIPVIETYRGARIFDHQPRARIDAVMKPEIDRVSAMTDPLALFTFAGDPRNSPEARLLAKARCAAAAEIITQRCEGGPAVDIDRLRAAVAGLDSVTWRSPWRHCSLLDVEYDQAVERDEPLPDDEE